MAEADSKGGRPTVFDEHTLQILEGAFADGATDGLACFLAQISPSSLYNYQNANPEFLERKKYLKEQTKFQAKKNIRKAIESGDLETSKWYAERKIKDEFSNRQEITGRDGEDMKLNVIVYGNEDPLAKSLDERPTQLPADGLAHTSPEQPSQI